MSYAADAPDTINGLRDALLACASWLAMFPGSGAGQLALATAAIHYPDADGTDVDAAGTPLAVLSIEAGSFEIMVAAIQSMGALEALGQALRPELMSRYRTSPVGLVIAAEPSVGRAGNPTGWAESAGDNAASIIITGPYGLSL